MDASSRRGFLRSLAALPLIGGGVTLIGSPTAAAEPITPALLDAYDEWLSVERRFLKWERFGPAGKERRYDHTLIDVVFRNRESGQCWDFIPCNHLTGRSHGYGGDSPASRAAVVLATAGFGWERD